MIIELQRRWVEGVSNYRHPSSAGGTLCGICARAFEEPSVVAVAATDHLDDMGVACPECVEYLGGRNPENFPTVEEYRELLAKHPRAMYPSEEALEAAGRAAGYEDPSERADKESWVWSAHASASS